MKFSSRLLLHLFQVGFMVILTTFNGTMSSAQNSTNSDSLRVEEEYRRFFDNELEISASTFEQATADYIQLAAGNSFPEERQLQLSLAEAHILCGLLSGLTSELFPIVIENHSDQVFDLPIRTFMLAGAYYAIGDFEQAAEKFRAAIERLDPAKRPYNFAHLNLASTYNELVMYDEAVSTLNALLVNPAIQLEGYEMGDLFLRSVKINLGGLLVSHNSMEEAIETLSEVDTVGLGEFWTAIQQCNLILAHQALLNFEERDQIWSQFLQHLPLGTVSDDLLYPILLHEILITRDFALFKEFKAHLAAEGTSQLLADTSRFHPLLSMPPGSSEEFETFLQFAKFADMEDDYLANLVRMYRDNSNAEISSLKQRLDDKQASLDKTLRNFGTASAIIIVLASGYFLVRRNTQHKTQLAINRVIEADQASKTSASTPLQITREDIRILGDTISYGRRISDAMIVLRKLKTSIDMDEQETTLHGKFLPEEHATKLNSRELAVANHLAAGFDAKEISRIMEVSPEYIYNVRSRIRTKLEIPAAERLEDWLQQTITGGTGTGTETRTGTA